MSDFQDKSEIPKSKVPKKRLIKTDKKHNDIKKKFRLKKNKPHKILKRVENFMFLSNLLTQQKKSMKSPKKEESVK